MKRIRARRGIADPPSGADFLLHLFARGPNREAFSGDLNEHYQLIRKKFGPGRAKIWYWTQVATSVPALLRMPKVNRPSRPGSAPPISAKFLFYFFLDKQNCDATVGDLEERYKTINKEFQRFRADLWYWKEAIRSIGPIVWAWVKKVVLKPVMALVAWAVAKGLVGHDSWLAAVVELWKRVRS